MLTGFETVARTLSVNGSDVALGLVAMEQNSELVARHPRHGIVHAGDRREPAADDLEQTIAGFVAKPSLTALKRSRSISIR